MSLYLNLFCIREGFLTSRYVSYLLTKQVEERMKVFYKLKIEKYSYTISTVFSEDPVQLKFIREGTNEVRF